MSVSLFIYALCTFYFYSYVSIPDTISPFPGDIYEKMKVKVSSPKSSSPKSKKK
jgi:hypothetical protein